jgi:hypothetical protein
VARNSTLTAKQQRAIAALLSESSVLAAAQRAGVPPRTLFTWLRDPGFVEEYRGARREVVTQAIAKLQGIASQAVVALADVVNDSAAPPQARVSAAKTVLDVVVKATEVEDLTARLEKLEQKESAT